VVLFNPYMGFIESVREIQQTRRVILLQSQATAAMHGPLILSPSPLQAMNLHVEASRKWGIPIYD
jgi:hypothetical protein